MSITQKIAKNTIIQVLSKVISTFLGILAIGLMTRYLGKEGFGGYATIIAFLQFFGIIVDMGLTLITVQMISLPNTDTNKVVSNIFTLRFFSALIFLGLAPLVVIFFPYATEIKIGVAITTLSFFLIALSQVYTGVFQKKLRMDKVALAEIGGRIGLVIFITIAVFLKSGLMGIMIAVVIGSFINFLILYAFSKKYIKTRWAFDFTLWKDIFKRSWPIAISIIFNLLYLKTDIIILSLYHSQADVGIYGAAYRVIDIINTFPYMFIGLILPLMTFQWASQNKEKFQYYIQMSFNILMMLALPMVIGTLFLAKPIMVLIAGDEFANSGSVLQILILAMAMVFVGSLFGHVVVAINKQKKVIWTYLITAVLSLIGYFIFIPKYSYMGAAWVTVFSEVLIMILITFYIFWKTHITLQLKTLYKIILCSAIMGLFLYLFKEVNVVVQIILAVFVYFGSLYLFKGISKETMKEIINIKN